MNSSTCSVHLINDGITIQGSNVTIEFLGNDPVLSYLCRLDTGSFQPCKHYNIDHTIQWPKRLGNLELKFDKEVLMGEREKGKNDDINACDCVHSESIYNKTVSLDSYGLASYSSLVQVSYFSAY